MKQYILPIIIIVAVIALGAFAYYYNQEEPKKLEKETKPAENTEQEQESNEKENEEKEIPNDSDNELKPEDIAKEWIEDSSSTYKFDGMNLELVEVRGLDLVNCENCYEVEFIFNSRHAGYGNRDGQILAQIITPHTIVVTVENGETIKVITDQKYDELNLKIING